MTDAPAQSAADVTDEDSRRVVATVVGEDAPPYELFRIALTEAVVPGFTEDRQRITVTTWRPGRPVAMVERS